MSPYFIESVITVSRDKLVVELGDYNRPKWRVSIFISPDELFSIWQTQIGGDNNGQGGGE